MGAKHIANGLSAFLWPFHTLGKPRASPTSPVDSKGQQFLTAWSALLPALETSHAPPWNRKVGYQHKQHGNYLVTQCCLSAIQHCRWGARRYERFLAASNWEMPFGNRDTGVPALPVLTCGSAETKSATGWAKRSRRQRDGLPREDLLPFPAECQILQYSVLSGDYHQKTHTDVHGIIQFSSSFGQSISAPSPHI